MIGRHRTDVSDEQHRQYDARRIARSEEQREHDDVHQAGTDEAGFGNPEAGGRAGGKKPLGDAQMRHGAFNTS